MNVGTDVSIVGSRSHSASLSHRGDLVLIRWCRWEIRRKRTERFELGRSIVASSTVVETVETAQVNKEVKLRRSLV